MIELIARYKIKLEPWPSIVYARIGDREVGVKYSSVGGDVVQAIELAVTKVVEVHNAN